MIQLEYSINKSDNGVNIYESRLEGNKVFALGNLCMDIGMNLHKFDLDYTYTDVAERGMHFTETYVLRPEVAISYPFGKEWSVTAFVRPEAASDFQGNWTKEGFNVSYGTYFTKTWGHGSGAFSSLMMGAEYSTAFGKPRIVPILNYKRKTDGRLSYAIGYPHTWVSWTLNRRHTIKPLLDIDAFYAGVNAVTGYFNDRESRFYKLNYLNVSGSVNYEYHFNQGWNLVAGLGYSIHNELERYQDDDEVYAYETAPAPYISLGIKYNF
ncbi:transporter [Sinomicrobium kalidii]|uniref:DUF6268 family outer membrane beta-barrel protein n=1 Tax=Sinomicrobium kalidii TaxID=2900738 RepID=UPI001E427C6A|nr:DUF6268 family outer membrane beta-barrel protein [Sinomicrobium kalidii]UGU14753.1 transporter [Sinomicrobium kalidii]